MAMIKAVAGYSVGLFSLALVACGSVPDGQSLSTDDPSIGEATEEDVDAVTQPLGAWRDLYSSTTERRQLAVGPTYTLFLGSKIGPDPCSVPVVLSTTTGEKLNVPEFPRCGWVSWAVSTSAGLFVHHQDRNAIFALIRGANDTYTWSAIAFTNDSSVKLATSSQHVYWQEGWTVFRVSRLGSPVATVATERSLVGVDGSDLYLIKQTSDGYDLVRRELAGTRESLVRANVDPGDVYDSTFDATHLYFSTEGFPAGSTNRIQRIARSGGALSTMKSSAEVLYVSPFSNGSALYWREVRISDGSATIRRRNHTNGNHVTQPFPMAKMEQMLVAPSGIYAIGQPETGVRRYALMRGDL